MQLTYTYTAADYREVFGGRRDGKVGVTPDGDLTWKPSHDQIVWAYETVVLNHVNLSQYQPDDVVYAPSPMMKAEFDARNGIGAS